LPEPILRKSNRLPKPKTERPRPRRPESPQQLEDLGVPTVALIDGVALGGGCELALACTYRVATFNDKVRIGCPEMNLGFNPGFGGTYRLPRVVGLAEGLKMILSGKPVDGTKALKNGLVDALVLKLI